jgi:hypothetical protein
MAPRRQHRVQPFSRQVGVELRRGQLDRKERGFERHHRAAVIRRREPRPHHVARRGRARQVDGLRRAQREAHRVIRRPRLALAAKAGARNRGQLDRRAARAS